LIARSRTNTYSLSKYWRTCMRPSSHNRGIQWYWSQTWGGLLAPSRRQGNCGRQWVL